MGKPPLTGAATGVWHTAPTIGRLTQLCSNFSSVDWFLRNALNNSSLTRERWLLAVRGVREHTKGQRGRAGGAAAGERGPSRVEPPPAAGAAQGGRTRFRKPLGPAALLNGRCRRLPPPAPVGRPSREEGHGPPEEALPSPSPAPLRCRREAGPHRAAARLPRSALASPEGMRRRTP